MKFNMRGIVSMSAGVALLLTAGCDWEEMPAEDAWNSGLSWVNFGGHYTERNGGVLVRDVAAGMSDTQYQVSNEALGSGNGSQSSFAGVLANDNIVTGSVQITAGRVTLVDDGAGNLAEVGSWTEVAADGQGTTDGTSTTYSGVADHANIVPGSFSISLAGYNLTDDGAGSLSGGGKTGTVVYATGAWFVDLNPTIVTAGQPIVATYSYGVSDAVGSINYATGAWAINLNNYNLESGAPIRATYRWMQERQPEDIKGNSGTPIYAFILQQTGHRLVFTDNNGNSFEGTLYNLTSSAGDVNGIPVTLGDGATSFAADIVASFIVEGTVGDQFVTIEGVMAGDLQGGSNIMLSRGIYGTWMESGGRVGQFSGFSGNAATADPVVIDPVP